MTEVPRSPSPEHDEPTSGSTEFIPGRPASGSQSASGSSSSPSGAPQPADSASGDTPPAGSGGPATIDDNPLARTRVSALWVGIIVFAIILILLLVFVLQNTAKVPITYFWLTGHIPLAVAMLLSAAAGVLLTAIAGTLRIVQLRKRLKANTS